MRKSSSGWRSLGIGWEDKILPDVDDPCNCLNTLNLGQSEGDQKLGKIECVFSSYDKMGWKWDDVYLIHGLPNIYSPLLWPPPLPLHDHTPTVTRWRCTWRPGLSNFCDLLPDRDWVDSEMNWEAGNKQVRICASKPRSSELSNELGGLDRVSLEMHLEAELEWTQRCTWRLRSNKLRDALGGRDRASVEMHFQTEI